MGGFVQGRWEKVPERVLKKKNKKKGKNGNGARKK